LPGFIGGAACSSLCAATLVEILKTVLDALRSAFRSRSALLAAIVVLRQQIIVPANDRGRPKLTRPDQHATHLMVERARNRHEM
jgi:hypothetical protein